MSQVRLRYTSANGLKRELVIKPGETLYIEPSGIVAGEAVCDLTVVDDKTEHRLQKMYDVSVSVRDNNGWSSRR